MPTDMSEVMELAAQLGIVTEQTPESIEAERVLRTWKRVGNHSTAADRAKAHADRAHAMLNVLAGRMQEGQSQFDATALITSAQAHADLAVAYAAVEAIPTESFSVREIDPELFATFAGPVREEAVADQ